MANNSGMFKPGDSRVHRAGRAKGSKNINSFAAFRELAQQIAEEQIEENGEKITRIESMLRNWTESKNAILQTKFTEVAYGKVPDKIAITNAEGNDIPQSLNELRARLWPDSSDSHDNNDSDSSDNIESDDDDNS